MESSKFGLLKKSCDLIPHFPDDKTTFIDIAPILANPLLFNIVRERMFCICPVGFDKVVAIDARGFIFGTFLAQMKGKGLVMARKKGKLPPPTMQRVYAVEYREGSVLEMAKGIIEPGDRVVIADDVLATGGSIGAAASMVKEASGVIVGAIAFIELDFLGGREKLGDMDVRSLLKFNKKDLQV